jgi:hypothetical protein
LFLGKKTPGLRNLAAPFAGFQIGVEPRPERLHFSLSAVSFYENQINLSVLGKLSGEFEFF